MSEHDGILIPAMQRPSNDDKEAWKNYWEMQGWSWRTGPEIDMERQKYLDERRNIKPDWKQGIFSFKDIKLSRADVEWLLATHENGRGPINWSDESQHQRKGLDLRGIDLCQVDLSGLPLAGILGGLLPILMGELTDNVRDAAAAHFERAIFWRAHLEEARLCGAHLEGAILAAAHLEGAILNEAFLDNATILNGVILSNKHLGAVSLVDMHWNDVNVAVVDWSLVKKLGDESEACLTNENDGTIKDKKTQLWRIPTAVRANRQLAVVLRDQGMNEEADYFAYRAQRLERIVLRRQRKYGKYLFSGFLDFLAGYGYRPLRSVFWYLVIIFGFAIIYFAFGHISPLEAFILSLTSFHGRGFFPGTNLSLSDPRVVLAAFEAVIGLFIEIRQGSKHGKRM